MTVNEANQRLTTTKITEETFWKINPLYLLLDMDKDQFCKIVDAVGVEEIAFHCNLYKKALHALEQQRKRERADSLDCRINALRKEQQEIIETINTLEREKKIIVLSLYMNP